MRTAHGILVGLALAAAVAAPAAGDARGAAPFDASFRGAFTITFATGPGGTDELRFHGKGRGSHLGVATVDGYSRLRPLATEPGCSEIVHDEVAVTAASGARLRVTNDAVDCLEITPDGRVLIHGRGTYAIRGGTGRFRGSAGSGTVMTEAQVTEVMPGGVSGTFDRLAFAGTIEP